ncbi:MAG: metal-dependent hydrolase [Sandaracinaceae bacterium]|nr:metal-dependent hydrolase [Sandaracinaceae bacterium]
MDSITQGLLGAAIAEAGFRRRLGGRAVAWGALCGVAPDFDFVAMIAGEWNELVHHRGVSHSLVALTVVAPILGALARRWPGQKQGSTLDWIHLTWWALITHPLLDTCTSYGTQLLAPLSDHRFAIDAVSIVDIAYTIPLLLAVLRARWGRDQRRSARFAAAMLALTTAYLGAGFVQSQRAIAWAEEELAAEGFASVETRALPTLGNLLVFRALARDGEGRYRVAILSLSAPRTPRWYAVRDDEDPLVAAARETERGRLFEWFAMRFFARRARPRGPRLRRPRERPALRLDARPAPLDVGRGRALRPRGPPPRVDALEPPRGARHAGRAHHPVGPHRGRRRQDRRGDGARRSGRGAARAARLTPVTPCALSRSRCWSAHRSPRAAPTRRSLQGRLREPRRGGARGVSATRPRSLATAIAAT